MPTPRSLSALQALALQYAELLEKQPATEPGLLAAILRDSCIRRTHEHLRLTVPQPSSARGFPERVQTLAKALRSFAGSDNARASPWYHHVSAQSLPVVMVFPGSGAETTTMGVQMLQLSGDDRHPFCALFAKHLAAFDAVLTTMVVDGEETHELKGVTVTAMMQMGKERVGHLIQKYRVLAAISLLGIELALADTLAECGVTPDYVLGYSLGEFVVRAAMLECDYAGLMLCGDRV